MIQGFDPKNLGFVFSISTAGVAQCALPEPFQALLKTLGIPVSASTVSGADLAKLVSQLTENSLVTSSDIGTEAYQVLMQASVSDADVDVKKLESAIVAINVAIEKKISVEGTAYYAAYRKLLSEKQSLSRGEQGLLSLSVGDRKEVLSKILHQSGLVDGVEWRREEQFFQFGQAVSQVSRNDSGPVSAVALSSLDASTIIPESIRGSGREEQVLKLLFTEKELNEVNLGVFKNAIRKDKFYSRVAGLLSLKAAIFRAAGLPLPGEVGGESLRWTDVEYVREAYTTDGNQQTRYRRVKNFSGEVSKRLEGLSFFANFTDEGETGLAIVVVEREKGKSGIIGLGIDVTDNRRFHSHSERAVSHALGESVYKLTYFGGHSLPFYMDSVEAEISIKELKGPGRESYSLTGMTQRAFEKMGGEEVVGTNVRVGNLVGALVVGRVAASSGVEGGSKLRISGQAHDQDGRQKSDSFVPYSPAAQAGDVAAPLEVKPMAAQLIDSGLVNVIFQYPGQAGPLEAAEFILKSFAEDQEARDLIIQRSITLKEKYNIDLDKMRRGEISPTDLAKSEVSQALIGLSQEVVNLKFAKLGYNFGRANVKVIGHSQGQLPGMNAIGAMPGQMMVEALGSNGILMARMDPYFEPDVTDSLTLASFNEISSGGQLAAILAYTGKISMLNTGGLNRADAEKIVEEVNREMSGTQDHVGVSLVNIEADPEKYQKLIPFAVALPNDPKANDIMLSGTTDALKLAAKKIMEGGANRKVRVALTTASFHSKLMVPGFLVSLKSLQGQKLGSLPTTVVLNNNGKDLRDVSGEVKVRFEVKVSEPVEDQKYRVMATTEGAFSETFEFLVDREKWDDELVDGVELTVDAQVYAVMRGQYCDRVEWPTVVYSAYGMGDPKLPTLVIDGGPGVFIAKKTQALLTDREGRRLATVVSFGSEDGRKVLESGKLADVPLVDPKIFTDPNYRSLLAQPEKGEPILNGEYTGPHGYLDQVYLADPVKRRDLIARLTRALNLTDGGEPRLHSEFLESLGYDPAMPMAISAMTGNNKVELIAHAAAEKILGIYAATTVGFEFDKLDAALDAIHRRSQELLREKGDPDWEKGGPFGVNIIHGTPAYKEQIRRIIAAKKRGANINLVSVAFSKIEPAEWDEMYSLLLNEGVTIMPLGENENRWDHFLQNIFPRVPKNQRHLLAIAPEGAEGGGHNVPKTSGSIRYGRDLTKSLLTRGGIKSKDIGLEVPWMMTGGQSTPSAAADALLVMAYQSMRGGVQMGGWLQVVAESMKDLPTDSGQPQVKAYIARAMAGEVGCVQAQSEFERAINMLDGRFSRDFERLSQVVADVAARDVVQKQADGTDKKVRVSDPIGHDRAQVIVDLFLNEPEASRQILHHLWVEKMNDFNRKDLQPIVDNVWPHWLAGDREALAAQLEKLTPQQTIAAYRTYRTMAIGEAHIDPESVYVLGGVSLRSMGRALEQEGQDPKKYLGMPLVQAMHDFRDRTIRYMTDLLERAVALEEAEQDKYALTTIENISKVQGVSLVGDSPLSEGETATSRFRLRRSSDAAKDISLDGWRQAVMSAGYGSLARTLRATSVGGGETDNPLHRTLIPENGDEVELVRRQEAGRIILEAVRIFDKSGRLVVEVTPTSDHKAVEETWHLSQKTGVQDSPVTWRYELVREKTGLSKIQLVPGRTAQQGRDAYSLRWTGALPEAIGNLGDPVTTDHDVTIVDALDWHDQLGIKSRDYTDRRRKGGIRIHKTYPLKAAWASMMKAGMHPAAAIDYLKVIHSGQTQRFGVPVKTGDRLSSTSQVAKIENNPSIEGTRINGREVTIVSVVKNQKGEVVAEYITRFLSQVNGLATGVEFENPVELSLSPKNDTMLKVSPLPLGKSLPVSLSFDRIVGYRIDDQWLHSDARVARRMNARFSKGVIAQGWNLLHAVVHNSIAGLIETDLKDDADRLIGFGEGTAITRAVLPGEKLETKFKREGYRDGREIVSFKLVPVDGGDARGEGNLELKPQAYVGVFPGNASQKVGMAKSLWEQGGIAKETLIKGSEVFGEEGLLLLDVITDGASIPEGQESRKAAFENAKKEDWLSDVENSSRAVLLTSDALRLSFVGPGFPQPSIVSGHSLGQYTAAVAAGALTLEDALKIVRFRGQLLKKYASGKIAAVMRKGSIDVAAVEVTLASQRHEGDILQVANINKLTDADSQVIVSGSDGAIQRFAESQKTGDYKVMVLPGNVAFHVKEIQGMENDFRAFLSQFTFSTPQIPLASIVVAGRRVTTAEGVVEELATLNHSPVLWDANVRSLQVEGQSRFVEFGNGNTLTGFNKAIVPAGISQSAFLVKHADELLYGPRPVPKVVTPAPAPQKEKEPDSPPAGPTAQPDQPAAVAVKVEPTPAPYTSLGMQVISLRLTTARVVVVDGAVTQSMVSPLAPKSNANASEFLWANTVLTLSDMLPGKVKPADLKPETTLDKDLGLDSLDVATFFGKLRWRNGISRMPTDDEVKKLEQGTLADVFALVASYWDHGDKPEISQRGAALGTAGKTYNEILADAGISSSKSVYDVVADGDASLESPGMRELVNVVMGAENDGAIAGVEANVKRVDAWEFHEKYKDQAGRLKPFVITAIQQAVPGWKQVAADREERNQRALAQQAMYAPAIGSAPVVQEPTPAPYTSLGMQVISLRLTTARVVVVDGAVTQSMVSPLAPKSNANASEFLWANTVLTLSDMLPGKVKPADLKPETTLDKDLGLDSLDVATFFGKLRWRNGISRMPTDDEVKKLEQGTLADVFALVASYWDHGDKPEISQRGAALGTAGKTYNEILADAGISSSKSVYDVVADGDASLESPGMRELVNVVMGAENDGAIAGVEANVKRVDAWEFHEKYKDQAGRLKPFVITAIQQAVPGWKQVAADREERNQRALAQARVPMPGMAMGAPAAKIDQAAMTREVQKAAALAVAAHIAAQGNAGSSRRLGQALEFDTRRGVLGAAGSTEASENKRQMTLLTRGLGKDFIKMMTTPWSRRMHPEFAEVEKNGAPSNLLRFFTLVSEGKLDPQSEIGKAEAILLANQIDALRIDLTLTLAKIADRKELPHVGEAMRRVAELGRESLRVGGLPQPIVWDSTRMVADYGSKARVKEVSRNLSPTELLDQWEREKTVDPRVLQRLRAMVDGKISYKGKEILLFGGTGTIAKPMVEFFARLGANVTFTTRQDFGRAEKLTRELRNRNCVRGNYLRPITGFEPSYDNIDALFEELKKSGKKPDFVLNGMAAEDYGKMSDRGEFHKVSHVLVDAHRYALGIWDEWLRQDDDGMTRATQVLETPNDFELAMSASYPIVKNAMEGYLMVKRRNTEGHFYKNGKPRYRVVGVDTGGTVPDSFEGIMGEFRKNGDALENDTRAESVRTEGRVPPVWVFSRHDMAGIQVASLDPNMDTDLPDLRADGNFREYCAVKAESGGLQTTINAVKRVEDTKHGDAAKTVAPEASQPYHPFQEGQLRTPKSYAVHITERDGARNPFGTIKDGDMVVVAAEMATTYGLDAIASHTTLLERVGGYTGPWGKYLGLMWTARAGGYDVKDKTPAQVAAMAGAELFANMGPRQLKADDGQRADSFSTFPITQEAHQQTICTQEEYEAAINGADPKSKALRERVADLVRTGYQFETQQVFSAAAEGETPAWRSVIVAKKEKANVAHEVKVEVGPQIVADLPPIKWDAVGGADDTLVKAKARHVLVSGLVQSGLYRQMGTVPRDVTRRHGERRVYTNTSFGMGGLNLMRDQQRNPSFAKDPGEYAVVFGIGAAAAGSNGQGISGSKGPATDTPGACNTGPTAIWHAKEHFQAAHKRAADARRAANEESDPIQKAVLEIEADELEDTARHLTVDVVTGDNGSTVETNILFQRVGAMLSHKDARNREFPDDVQQRPHDKNRIKQFQSGVGFGALKTVTGWAVKQYGYTPLARVAAADIGSDGPRKEPDGKKRAPTGLGRWGQRKVFRDGLREARRNGALPKNLRIQNSHSTGTIGDPTQSESFFIAVVEEALDWAIKTIAVGGSARHLLLSKMLREKGIDAKTLMRPENEEQQVRALGFSIDNPYQMMQEITALGIEFRSELGLPELLIENHPKGAGYRHTLGGTSIEFVSLLMQAITKLSLPNPGLNNIENSTGDSPIAMTLPNVTELAGILGEEVNYKTDPREIVAKAKRVLEAKMKALVSDVILNEGDAEYDRQLALEMISMIQTLLAQNSFGFNGLDGYVVAEMTQGLHFETTQEAVRWFTANIQNHARSIAMYRGRNSGSVPGIMNYEYELANPQDLYADTKEVFENAESYARKLVDREDFTFPWERRVSVEQRAVA